MTSDIRANLLCVDDEPGILRSLRRLLRGEDFNVITASSGLEALEVLAEQPVQVMVADPRMPDMSGIELIERVKHEHPHVVRVVLSGFADIATILSAINRGEVFRYLGKPWNDEELKTMLRQCFIQYRLEQENQQLLELVNQQNHQLAELNGQLEKQIEAQQQGLDETVSNLKKIESGLKMMHGIVQNIPLPLFGIDKHGQVVMANARAIAIAGERLAIGNRLADIVDHDVEAKIQQQLKQSAVAGVAAADPLSDEAEYLAVEFGRVSAFPFAIDTRVVGGLVVVKSPKDNPAVHNIACNGSLGQ